MKTSEGFIGTVNQWIIFILVQFFLFDFQLQHDGVELHVEIVGSLQLPLVVLPDVQRMSVWRGRRALIHLFTDIIVWFINS